MDRIDEIRERAELLKEGDFFEGDGLKQFPQDVINLCDALKETKNLLNKRMTISKARAALRDVPNENYIIGITVRDTEQLLSRIDQIMERDK